MSNESMRTLNILIRIKKDDVKYYPLNWLIREPKLLKNKSLDSFNNLANLSYAHHWGYICFSYILCIPLIPGIRAAFGLILH